MRQIPVGFDKKTEAKLRHNAKAREISLAQYIRSLVEIGLRVEEMAQDEKPQNQSGALSKMLELQQKLLQKNLVGSYENLYLTRYILTHMPESEAGQHHQMLDNAQSKAKALVEGLSG